MMSPGTAFLLAYLPARRLAFAARHDHLQRITTADPKLARAVESARDTLEWVEESVVEADGGRGR